MRAWWHKYILDFKRPARTSRGEMTTRTVWFLFLEKNGKTGIGECAPLPGLSIETPEQVEHLLEKLSTAPEDYIDQPELTVKIPSVHFALETAWLDLNNGGKQKIFPSDFIEGKSGIPVNALVWMGNADFMLQQVHEKLEAGYHCIKLKIGGIDFELELEILKAIRDHYSSDEIIIRLDANGAFAPDEALFKLDRLAPFQIHSIEQPVAMGQHKKLAEICRQSPIPVALDEELIGIHTKTAKEQLLNAIRPAFLILKPSLHGGISGCTEWIELAHQQSTGWWVTSYLESNIGLNAIAQWAFHQKATGFQGLGTGALYTNNIPSPLEIRGEMLWTDTGRKFKLPDNFSYK